MNHWWLLISEILWLSYESKFTTSAQVNLLCINQLENYPPEIIVPGPNAMGLMCTKLTATGDFVTMTMSTYPSLSGCSAIPEKEEGTEWLLLIPSTRSKPRPGCAATRSWYSYTRPRVGSLFWYTEKRMHACGQYHNYVITWNASRITGPLWGESVDPRRIPSSRVSDVEFWRFYLLSAWTGCWTNGRVAGHLRRHDAHVTSLLWRWID